MDLLAFLQAHAAERCNRLAERAVDLWRLVFRRENEAIDVAAETHGEQTERPFIAGGGGGRGGEAVDGEFLDACRIDMLYPAGLQVVGQGLLGRHAHHVEAHRLVAALEVQKAAAAREALARILAIDYSVEIAEIFGAVAFARAGAAELPGIGKR